MISTLVVSRIFATVFSSAASTCPGPISSSEGPETGGRSGRRGCQDIAEAFLPHLKSRLTFPGVVWLMFDSKRPNVHGVRNTRREDSSVTSGMKSHSPMDMRTIMAAKTTHVRPVAERLDHGGRRPSSATKL
ncbi:hypothetical protein CPLU01_13309 [Colletotrichum plurivorum]|uniref:Secreted protein n=1 Tax=Colletotrichum plurivorum TaxID=2175906 RepID=A0A8H6N3V0_9PEZI|nr:hypothetical protein CPLU01_13309 [Colletotrichum plurivorum]